MGPMQLLIPALLALPPATASDSFSSLRANPPSKRSAPAAYASALRKWGKNPPDEASGAGLAKGVSGTSYPEELDAKSHENDTFYTVDIQVGSPGQMLPVILDTGSSDLWVYWSETDYAGLGKSEWPKHYDAADSSTGFEITGAEWSVQYADGTQASGPVAIDTLTLSTLRLPNATLQLANTTSPSLLDSGASGVMGLARTLRTSIVPYDVPTVRERLVEAGQRFLSIDLRVGGGSYRINDSETGGTGDTSGMGETGAGDVTWFESWGSHWTVQVTDFNVGNDTASTSNSTSSSNSGSSGVGFEGVVDTGTTLLLVPDAYATTYYLTIPSARQDLASSMWLFPCALSPSLPDLQLMIGGAYEAVVPGAFLNFGSVEDHPAGGRVDGPAEEMCYGGVQSSEGLGVEAILGDVFLKSQLVVLDLEDGRVGFAKKDAEGDVGSV